MMIAVEEEKHGDILPESSHFLIKPLELKNIGFLQKYQTYIHCPACQMESLSFVRFEVATYWQRFLNAINMCKTIGNYYDINHYCSKCGCYIGRYVPIGCGERCISKQARKKAAHDAMILKTKPKDCAEHMQKARERIKENQAREKNNKKSKETNDNEQMK